MKQIDRDVEVRVAVVHGQTWPTLRLALVFAVAAAAVAPVVGSGDRWIPLHLLLVGAVLAAISAATQMFAVTWSSAPAPPGAVVRVQRWLVALGAPALVLGRVTDVVPLAALGGMAVVAALGVLAGLLTWIRRHRRVDRFLAALDAYLLAVAFGVVGCLVGVAMVLGGTPVDGGLRGAHLVLNLLGFVGLVVVGTLPTFVATQTRTRIPSVARRLLRPVVVVLAASVIVAAAAMSTDHRGVAAVALAVYAVAFAANAAALLQRIGRRQREWAGPRLVQMFCALAWWAIAVAVVAATPGGPAAASDGWVLLAVGGVAQLVVASLAYLGPVLRGRDAESQARAFRLTRSWPSLVLGNLAAVAVLAGWWPAAGGFVVLWALDVVGRATLLVVKVDAPNR